MHVQDAHHNSFAIFFGEKKKKENRETGVGSLRCWAPKDIFYYLKQSLAGQGCTGEVKASCWE